MRKQGCNRNALVISTGRDCGIALIFRHRPHQLRMHFASDFNQQLCARERWSHDSDQERLVA
jgi:hypothetical protein